MSSVSQIIPNFIGGINDQPDELKKPGQVRDAVNMIPDVVKGLYKRPGYEEIANGIPDVTGGTWLNMFAEESDGDKRYIFHVSNDGIVRAWDADLGDEKVVRVAKGNIDLSVNPITLDMLEPYGTAAKLDYFNHGDATKLKFTSKEDTLFITNPEVIPGTSGTEDLGVVRPFEAFVEVTTVDETRAYPITIDFIDFQGDTKKKVTKLELNAQVNFSDFDRQDGGGGNCTLLTGIYNVKNDPVDNRPGATPVTIRVEIRSNPVAFKSATRCKYYVYDMQLLDGGEGYKQGDMLSFKVKDNTVDPTNDAYVRYEVKETAKLDAGIDELVSAVIDTDAVNVETIIGQWHDKLKGNSRFTAVEKVGNGLYLASEEHPFIVDTTEKDVINILSSTAEEQEGWEKKKEEDGGRKPDIRYRFPCPYASVNNVADLPLECRAGFLCKVENTYSDQDDYYVRFINNYSYADSTDRKGRASGQGYWKEVAKPGEPVQLNAGTLPHIIRRGFLKPTGDKEDAFVLGPLSWVERKTGTKADNPSFIENSTAITNLFFYRNRLMLLAGESVVSSQAGDFTNLFPVTAVTTTPKDPIDITADTYYSSKLQAGIVVNNAAVIFSEFQQFILTTDGDVFDTRTAKMSQISKFHFDVDSEPFMLDTNIGFKGGSQDGAKVYEMTNIFREGQVDAIERSKLVYNTLRDKTDYSMLDTSRETGTVYMAGEGQKDVYIYKYFKEGSQKDLMTAWVRWELPEPIVFHFSARDMHYVVTEDGKILRMSPDDETYEDAGVPVEASVSLPKLYVVKSEQQSFRADTTASTTIHRIKLNTGNTNYYIAYIDRLGKDPYEVEYEQTIMDGYIEDESPETGYTTTTDVRIPEREETIQLYERNTNLDIKLTSPIGPFQLYSMRWEGDYNSRYYQRV